MFSPVSGKSCSTAMLLHYSKNFKCNDDKILHIFTPSCDKICQPKFATRILATKNNPNISIQQDFANPTTV
jgi:hypothetical protein